MLTEKANAICLLEVLKEYSDAEHILPMREIIAKMQSLYGIKIDRRTVYGAVALLIELGYDISLYEDNGVGYYLLYSPSADRAACPKTAKAAQCPPAEKVSPSDRRPAGT